MGDLLGGLAVACLLVALLLWAGVRAERRRAGIAEAQRYVREGIGQLEEWLSSLPR